MPEPLTFLMGKFAAALPADLRYCRNHMWCRPADDGAHRFGFTAYAIRLMQDVYFLDWCVNVGDALAAKQQVGNIETSKAVSDLFAPIGGRHLGQAEPPLRWSLVTTGGFDLLRPGRRGGVVSFRPNSVIETTTYD